MTENDRLIDAAVLQFKRCIHEAIANNREGSFGAKVSIRNRKGRPEITNVYEIIERHAAKAA